MLFSETFWDIHTHKLLMTFLIAMVPVIELRGAIPAGVAAGLPVAAACIAAIAGNLMPAPVVIVLGRRVANWLRNTRFFGPKIVWLERRAHLKGRLVRKYRLLGLVILVGVPLPGTGVWTGSLVVSVLDIRMRHALPAIFLGLLIAAGITTALTLGLFHLF